VYIWRTGNTNQILDSPVTFISWEISMKKISKNKIAIFDGIPKFGYKPILNY
jgi:hypothetical protein